jgi:hypothetical protein
MCLLGVAFTRIEPLLVLPAMGASALALKLGNRFFYPVAAIGWLWQVYVLLAWCLVALLLTLRFMGTHHWFYYTIGFVECLAPIMYMQSHDYMNRATSALEDFKNLAILAVAAGGFILFAISPVFAIPWLWWLRWLWPTPS